MFERFGQITPRVYHQRDDGDPAHGGGERPPKPRRVSLEEIAAQFGDDIDAVRRAYRDVRNDVVQYRWSLNEARDRVAELERVAPPAGSVVLSAADAAQWETYKSLGAPDAVKQQLTASETAARELAGLRRDRILNDVASAHGYDRSALAHLAGDRPFELRDEMDNGQPVKRAYIKDGDATHPLDSYARDNWSVFLPVLTAPAHGGGAADPPARTDPRVPYPPQPPARNGQPNDLVSEYLSAREPARQ